MKNKKIKKVFVIFLCAIIICGITACSSSATNCKEENKLVNNTQNNDSKYQYVKDFENLGFGMFVHFGLYSTIGKGEWYLNKNPEANVSEYEKTTTIFDVDRNWAEKLVETAKEAGAKYITITTRHHDGFSLYDTKGINTYDAPHSKCQRDLIKEFVEACNKGGIKPFFYHTLLDWHETTYNTDFDKYLDYLYNSVELLCKNYGKVGGFWFDGSWDKPEADWKYDRLYNMIKSYQPEAMIINNTGLEAQGKVSNPMVDSVTYERGNLSLVDNSDRPRAGEMCESITDHWGYTQDDLSFKSVAKLIDILLECRQSNCNLLLNVGPRGNGLIGDYEKQTLQYVGKWISCNKNFIYNIRSTSIKAENAYIVSDGQHYYAIIRNVPMSENVKIGDKAQDLSVKINTDKKIINAKYLDSNESQEISNNFDVKPFEYGRSLYARILQFDLE